MEGNQHFLWQPVTFNSDWINADTSVIDDIMESWLRKRDDLKENSKDYEEFLERLKREHAIETGVVERIYDLDRGVTETLIKEGFHESLVSHGDTNVDKADLFAHLKDHMDAVDFVFDVVGEEREITVGFINQLHALTARNQKTAEGRDKFGNKTTIPLRKGAFKIHVNNPTRNDGVSVIYCPPEHVAAEMDNLIELHNESIKNDVHPLIRASWFHHSFSMIHPYQDGNGRVARLISSLILVKAGLFPLTVRREESKLKYIAALEKADQGIVQPLVSYFGQSQKDRIDKALNIQDVSGTSNDMLEVARILGTRIKNSKEKEKQQRENILNKGRMDVFEFCLNYMDQSQDKLAPLLGDDVTTSLESAAPNDSDTNKHYKAQIIKYAKKHDYYFNTFFPTAYVKLRFNVSDGKAYHLLLSLHHYGYNDSTLALGAFLEPLSHDYDIEQRIKAAIPLDLNPHTMSLDSDFKPKEKNITTFIDNALTLTMAHIASEI